jgi:hypothetical protein
MLWNDDLNRKERSHKLINGERGIRTLVRVTPKQHFQCCAFNRSAISPGGTLIVRSLIIGENEPCVTAQLKKQ